MLTEEQTKWCMQKVGLAPGSIPGAINFLFQFGKTQSRVEIAITPTGFALYARNKFAEGKDIQEAAEKLVEMLFPTPDPDPYLTEHLIDTVAPGVYPSWPDKVNAAEMVSRAQANEFLVDVS